MGWNAWAGGQGLTTYGGGRGVMTALKSPTECRFLIASHMEWRR